MEKQVFYPREKLLATDLNNTITDTETFGKTIITDLLIQKSGLNYPIILSGLTGSPAIVPDDTVTVSAGLAYSSAGERIEVPSPVTLVWDGTNAPGFPTNHAFRRIDVVLIRRASVNVNSTRYFIDANPASSTFGQQIVSSVTIGQTDGYEFFVQTGTEAADPPIPTPIAGWIPLFLVYVHSFNDAGGPLTFVDTGATHPGSSFWRGCPSPPGPDYGSDIDNYYYQNYNKITLSALEDKLFDIPIDENIGAGTTRATDTISPNWTNGVVTLATTVDVTSPITRTEFVGSGLNDMDNFGSDYDPSISGYGPWQYHIEIDTIGATDKFKWRELDSGAWTLAVPITAGAPQVLSNGIQVTFAAGTGHKLGDYWEFDVSTISRQPVYGANNTAEPEPENFIFGKITSIIPGAVTVTFYRGNPEGTLGVDYWASNCNTDVYLTYPLRVPLRNLPTDVFRNNFQTGVSIDMNLEKRIEEIETGITLDPLYLRRDVSAPAGNTLNRQISIRSDLFSVPGVAPFIVTPTAPGVPTGICAELNADRLDSLHIGQGVSPTTNYIPYADGAGNVGIGTAPSYAIDISSNRAIRIQGASGYLYTNNINPATGGNLRINANVGVNTVPSYTFDVSGSGRFTSSLYANSTLTVTSTTTCNGTLIANSYLNSYAYAYFDSHVGIGFPIYTGSCRCDIKNTSGYNGALSVEDTVSGHTAMWVNASATGPGSSIGIYAESHQDAGYGVHGQGPVGIYGTGTVGVSGAGVFTGLSTTGVQGTGDVGIYGYGSLYGGYFFGNTGIYANSLAPTTQYSGYFAAGIFVEKDSTSGGAGPVTLGIREHWIPSGVGTVAVWIDRGGAVGELALQASSIKFKKDINDLSIDLEKIYQLRPVSFKWKDSIIDNQKGEYDFGLLAEDTYKIIPRLVSLSNEGEPISVSYEKLGVLLLMVVKDQKNKMDQLEKRISLLEKGK